MGLIEFIVLCIITLVIAYGGIWLLGYLVPGHPAIIDKVIWILACAIILVALVRATGLMSYDPQIPRVR